MTFIYLILSLPSNEDTTSPRLKSCTSKSWEMFVQIPFSFQLYAFSCLTTSLGLLSILVSIKYNLVKQQFMLITNIWKVKNQHLKSPSNNLNNGLHLSTPRVELDDSTKFHVFLYQHKIRSNLCLIHLSWAPKLQNHWITPSLHFFSILVLLSKRWDMSMRWTLFKTTHASTTPGNVS